MLYGILFKYLLSKRLEFLFLGKKYILISSNILLFVVWFGGEIGMFIDCIVGIFLWDFFCWMFISWIKR